MVDAKYLLQRGTRRALRRPFEADFAALRTLDLPAGAEFLDVGANRGQTIDAVSLTAPGVRIVSFEPNPAMADQLTRRFRRREDVSIRSVALGEERGQATLFVPVYRGYPFDGLASLDRHEAESWLVGQIYGFSADRLEVKEVAVDVVPLDDFGLIPGFAKLDVQGTEIAVLRGAAETLARYRPGLLIETPSVDVENYLADFGYRPFWWSGSQLVAGRGSTVNTFFFV